MYLLLSEPRPDWSHDEGCGEIECFDADPRWAILACWVSAVLVLALTAWGVWAIVKGLA